MIDQRAIDIADAALQGQGPSFEELLYLLDFDAYSAEAAYIKVIARQLATKASGGRAFIHAQIGVDSCSCPKNCVFCSFAAGNRKAGEPAGVVALEDIVEAAQLFAQLGVHLISLMSTAALSFDTFVEMVATTRKAIGSAPVLMVNTRDMSLEEACTLKEAGADAAYHAVRLGEGRITDISPQRRKATIQHIHEAGLALMTGVEPVWAEVDHEELASAIASVPSYDAFAMGSCGLTAVDGIDVSMTPATTGYIAYVGALCRLACGIKPLIGGAGGAKWVDSGCDPRSRGFEDMKERIVRDFKAATRALQNDNWILPEPNYLKTALAPQSS